MEVSYRVEGQARSPASGGTITSIRSLDKLIALVFSLFVALVILWAMGPVFSSLFSVVPSPANVAISTYSTYGDATEIGAIILNIVAVVGGSAAAKDPRVTLGIIGGLFIVFLITGL
jgi:hypothetical protein